MASEAIEEDEEDLPPLEEKPVNADPASSEDDEKTAVYTNLEELD